MFTLTLFVYERYKS